MPQVILARNAMATRFELVLHGDDPVGLRAAGEEALDEIERLEAQLSLFRPSSEIAHLNARAAREPVQVTPPVLALIEHARRLSRETGGAFDITVAPLVRCWGFMAGGGRQPSAEDLAVARQKVGMHLVSCNEAEQTVSFAREGVMLDLGAIGKGYAIERAAEVLREAGVESALLHGGTSTVYALGKSPDGGQWQVAIEHPLGKHAHGGVRPLPGAGKTDNCPNLDVREDITEKLAAPEAGRSPAAPVFASVHLEDEALSVSAVWGKFFQQEGKVFGHVIDPRSGQPASAALLAAVVLPSATESDALSTALLTLGLEGHEMVAAMRPGMRTLIAAPSGGALRILSRGIVPQMGEPSAPS